MSPSLRAYALRVGIGAVGLAGALALGYAPWSTPAPIFPAFETFSSSVDSGLPARPEPAKTPLPSRQPATAVARTPIEPITSDADPFIRLVLGLAAGIALALSGAILTRRLAKRADWAAGLARDLAAPLQNTHAAALGLLALTSGVCEELFFRGFLLPTAGLLVSSAAFGLIHYVPGPSRWAWVASATCVGLCCGLIVTFTGALWGAILGHVLLNLLNMIFLRDRRTRVFARRRA